MTFLHGVRVSVLLRGYIGKRHSRRALRPKAEIYRERGGWRSKEPADDNESRLTGKVQITTINKLDDDFSNSRKVQRP